MLLRIPLIIFAKFLRLIVRIRGGHGSALPGLVIEKIDSRFLFFALRQLTGGVVVVTGTNGKTTTTHMLVKTLQSQGKEVLTNSSGSNLTRGLISVVVEKMTFTGRLPFDVAVFELDEAYAPRFTKIMPPKLLIALNVMRDQLDRYGEIELTADYIAAAAKCSDSVLVNANDDLLSKKVAEASQDVKLFGLDDSLAKTLVSEENLYANTHKKRMVSKGELYSCITDVSSSDVSQKFTLDIKGDVYKVALPLLGIHNALNASVAISATSIVLKGSSDTALSIQALEHFQPAFGRGETIEIKGKEVTVALVKNPSGFTQNIATYVRPSISTILIVINDEYADGRDVSWLWDIQLGKLKEYEGAILVGGKRRFDMVLCLEYQGLQCRVVDTDDVAKMMQQVLAAKETGDHLLIVPTYTAMLQIRQWLARQKGVKRLW